MSNRSAALARAKKAVGGNTGLGKLLGVTSQAISQWKQVPAERVIDVERATHVPRHELRPDIFPPPSGALATPAKLLNNKKEGVPGTPGHFSRFKHLRKSHFSSGDEIVAHVLALREEWDRR